MALSSSPDNHSHLNMSSGSASPVGDMSLDEHPRKLAVLGLPWETSEDTLRLHFSQYGVVEAAEVMKDRFSGKSRGFGFVTFVDPASAQRALTMDHTVDGRRCEAKIALPKTLLQGDMAPQQRTARIFVARIPASVTESQFRGYFEKYGRLQDAYMPKDHSKQAYRGIGFVTFASPESVEKVMATKHWMNGHEIAIDRATPKDDGKHFVRPPSSNQRRSFDNGAGIVGPGLTPLMSYQPMGLHADPAAASSAFQTAMRALSLERDGELNPLDHMAVAAAAANGAADMGRTSYPGGEPLGSPCNGGMGGDDMGKAGRMSNSNGINNLLGGMTQNDFNAAALQNLMKAHAALSSLGPMPGMGLPPLGGMPPDMSNAMFGGLMKPTGPPPNNRKSMDNAMHASHNGGAGSSGRRSMESPAIVNARSGPRIFIGKLTKDTSEADVKEYFSRFGYVMDVYMPKAKDNKTEHRGFGFVTFETDAAIKRVVGAGTHKLKGSTIAIDIAMPKVEEDLALDLANCGGGFGPGFPQGPPGMPGGPHMGIPPFDAATAALAAAAAARQFQALPMMM